jgi:hypothetical protein
MSEQIEHQHSTLPSDLAEVRPANEGGIIGLSGLKYQYHYAAKLCLEMITSGGEIEYVACELQDDIAAKMRNGFYKFYQAKTRTGNYWTTNRLIDEGVLQGFLRCRQEFGEGHSYWFITDQDCTNRINRQPDLGRWQVLTRTTRALCRENELNDAQKIIITISQGLGIMNQHEAESFFWSTRILRKITKRELILDNLQQIALFFDERGIVTDNASRRRIYRDLVSIIEAKADEDIPEATYREMLERRKVDANEVEACLNSNLFRQTQPSQFDIDVDPENRTLRRKLSDAEFPEFLKRFFIESRNRFMSRFRKDFIHASEYLRELRWKVWNLCVDVQTSTQQDSDYRPNYNLLKAELVRLAETENRNQPTIELDYDYLHGMVCQLTAECNHEWSSLE